MAHFAPLGGKRFFVTLGKSKVHTALMLKYLEFRGQCRMSENISTISKLVNYIPSVGKIINVELLFIADDAVLRTTRTLECPFNHRSFP